MHEKIGTGLILRSLQVRKYSTRSWLPELLLENVLAMWKNSCFFIKGSNMRTVTEVSFKLFFGLLGESIRGEFFDAE